MIKLSKKNFPPPVDSKYYTKDYFLNWGHYDGFLKSKGSKLIHEVHKRVADIIQIRPGMKVLDLGCGRGELLVHMAHLGAFVEGVDYSDEAIKFSKTSIKTQSKNVRDRIKLKQVDVKNLDLPQNYYDWILAIELFEHLRPWEIDLVLPKIKNALKNSGYLLIHTSPNRLAFYGFCLYRLWHYLIYGRSTKIKIRDNYYDKIIHINEQTPFLLKKTLKKHNFCYRVWLETSYGFVISGPDGKSSWIKKIIIKIIKFWPFKLFFFNNIYAIAWSKNAKRSEVRRSAE